MITQTTPSITDAAEYKEAHGSIPGGSIIRTTDQRLMVVERSNGYVISGMEQGKTGINANMVIDLRNTSATIVTVTTFVDDTPAPEASKVTKMTKAQRAALQIVANANATGVNATRWNAGCFEGERGIGGMYYCVSIAIADKLEAMGMIKREGHMQIRITDAGRAALTGEVKPAPVKKNPDDMWTIRNLMGSVGVPSTPLFGNEWADIQKREYHAALEIEAKPTTSPALVETGERVIAVTVQHEAAALVTAGKDVKPMELSARIVKIGDTNYRITQHATGMISVERQTTPKKGKPVWDWIGNYATAEQVARFEVRTYEEWQRTQKSGKVSPCALLEQWHTIPLLPAPVVATPESAIPFVYDDGGREAAGYKGQAGDCVTRAIAIASGKSYQEVYDALNALAKDEKPSKRRKGTSSARTGVHKTTYEKYLRALGFEWTPTMQIGQGCTVHLRASELPSHGRYIVSCSKHTVALIDGVVHDTYDPSRDGTRCVYGYWKAPQPAPVVKPEAPRPADVRTVYKAHEVAAVYGVVAGDTTWTVYVNGPVCGKMAFTRFLTSESALMSARNYINIKCENVRRKGTVGL